MKSKVIKRMTALLLTVVMSAGLYTGFTVRAQEPVEKDASSLSNPEIVPDSSMEAGQKVTWDCVWFGSYPQAEVVPSAEEYTAVDKSMLREGDIIADSSLYDTLQSASGWNDNNEITLQSGDKYRRIKKEDATWSFYYSSEYHYNWSDAISWHYFRYEPIKWRILKTDGNEAFLISDIALDDQQYHTVYEDVTWETSTIRSWLNGYGVGFNKQDINYSGRNFIGSSFTSEEQIAIVDSAVVNADGTYNGTFGGNDTADKIFFLSESEVFGDSAISFGFDFGRVTDDDARRCSSSTYAKAMGISAEYYDNKGKGCCEWWLRSPGHSSDHATYVSYDGCVDTHAVDYRGWGVDFDIIGVRPALNLNLASNQWLYAGTVCSDGTEHEINSPSTPAIPGQDNTIAEFTLTPKKSSTVNKSVSIGGSLKLSEAADSSGNFLESELKKISWSSNNPAVAEVTACKPGLYVPDNRSVAFSISVMPKAKGTVTITGKTSNGLTASCELTVEEAEEDNKDDEFIESIYHASYIYDWNQDTGADGYLNFHVNSETPSQIMYSAAKENGLDTEAVLWDKMKKTLETVESPSKILDVDKTLTKKDLYEGIIFAIFQDASINMEIPGEDLVKDASRLMGTIKTVMADTYGITVGEAYDLSGMTQQQKETLRTVSQDYFKSNSKIAKAAASLGKVSKTLDTLDEVMDYAEHCIQCEQLAAMTESYKQILADMLAACLDSNKDLKDALSECADIMRKQSDRLLEDAATGAMLSVGKQVVKKGMDKLWDNVKISISAAHPAAAMFWASYKAGMFISDSVFQTSDIAERTIKLSATTEVCKLAKKAYEKEKSAFASKRDRNNAENYLASIDIYYSYLDQDCESALAFTSTVTDSLWGKLYKKFGVGNGEELKKYIQNASNSYRQGYGFTQVNWITALELDYPEEHTRYKDSIQELSEKYYIHCPVDIRVTNASGETVASVTGGMPWCKEGEPLTVSAEGEKKEIWFYSGKEQYTISYTGTDTGTMDITVEKYENEGEYNNSSRLTRTIKYTDIPLQKDIRYTSTATSPEENPGCEIREEKGGSTLAPVADTGDTTKKKYALTLDNAYLVTEDGMAFSGEFCEGEKVTVCAADEEGMVFTGWESSIPGTVISAQKAKTAIVTMPSGNVKLTAQYEKEQEPDDGRGDKPSGGSSGTGGNNTGGSTGGSTVGGTLTDGKKPAKKNTTQAALLKKVKVTKQISLRKKKSKKIKVSKPSGLKVKSITYRASNKKIVSVSKKGKVTGKKKGSAKIKVTVKLKNGKKKTFTVKVKVRR